MNGLLGGGYSDDFLKAIGIDKSKMEEEQKTQGLLSAGLALLAGSGPSSQPRGLGQLVGAAGMQGIQAMRGAGEDQITNAVRSLQVKDMMAKREQDAARKTAMDAYLATLPESERAKFAAFPTQAADAMFREKPETFTLLTDQEKATRGLPANKQFQLGSKSGKVSEVGGGGVTILPGEGELQKGFAQYGVKTNTGIYESAQQAEKNMPRINETIKLIESGDITTGFGAELRNNIERAKAMFTQSKKSIQNVSDTELLNSLLGSEVFRQIGALGIGSKGMDTPAEREFLREVMTGKISNSKETLLKLAQLRKKYEERSIDTYNKAVESGQLNKFFEYSGLPKRKIDVTRKVNY